MGLSDVVDKFLNQHGLADTGTAEQTNLSTTSVGGKQVDNLDTSLQDFGSGRLLNEGRRVGMDWTKLDTLDGTPLINWFTNDVHDTAQGTLSDRDLDGSTSVYNLLPTDETLGTVHSNGSDRVLTKVSSDLEDETTTVKSWTSRALRIGGKLSVSN
jgi:hypothetical protein